MKLARVDYIGRLEVAPEIAGVLEAAAALPGHVPAQLTPEGYLLAWALVARDGLLDYSDGARSWQELRPRAELEAAAESFARVPVTDGHPPAMLSAATWATHARGHALAEPEIVELEGVAYMRAQILICDEALVGKATRGEAVEVSIGFWSDVIAEAEYPEHAAGAEAVQTGLIGNHYASVDRGRAGPACRVLLDGAAVPTHWPGLVRGLVQPLPPRKKTDSMDPKEDPAKKGDELGSPVEMTEVEGPDGKMYPAPTFLVGERDQLRAMLKGAAPAAPAAPPMAASMPPAGDMAGAPAAAPGVVKPEGMDAAGAFRARMKLERRAVKLGVAEAKLDAADDAQLLELVDTAGRELVAARMPHAAEVAKASRGDGLAALVDAALAAPTPKSAASVPAGNPWAQPAQPTGIAPRTDAADEAVKAFLAKQGVA